MNPKKLKQIKNQDIEAGIRNDLMEEGKIYCKNCKWDDGLHFEKQGCGLMEKDEISGRFVCQGKNWWDKTKLAQELNGDNDCPHYKKKKKWWKFWLK